MGCRNGGFSDEEDSVPPLLNDALFFMTMYLIGLPVDVHIKDGSVYSGIFYTASMDDNYAIVLKKATMMKKGNREVNIEFGSLVDTLVVQGEDLVQVVAKEVTISENDIFEGDVSGKRNQSTVDKHVGVRRKAGDGLDVNQSEEEEKPEYQEPENVDPLHFPSIEKTKYTVMPVNVPSHDPFNATAKLDDESYEKYASEQSPYFDGVLGVSTYSKPILHVNNSISSKPAKDSKLNPEAKIFTPSAYRQVFVIPTIPAVVPSMGYILDPSLMATADAIQPEYDVTGHAGDGIHDSPYHFEAASAYMNQSSQNAMVGQMGLPVYLPPLARDAVSVAGLSQLSLPPLLAQYHQAQMPKHQDHYNDPYQT